MYRRGGAPIGVRERWQAGDTSLDKRLAVWAELFRGCIPHKLPYDLNRLAGEYDRWPNDPRLPNALQADAIRVFQRKKKKLTEDQLAWIHERLATIHDVRGLRTLGEEMLAAQQIAVSQQAADPPLRGSLVIAEAAP